MSDQTVTSQADSALLPEQVYDMIMADIDPDLLLQNIPWLDSLYAFETPEDHVMRMNRYKESYKKFDLAFAEFMTDVNGSVRHTQRTALKAKEDQANLADQNTLNSLASAFN